ncbi:DegT/DnrJ/EryC1/StrS aminotransferase family protein, partial [Acetomicrobium mobile]
MSLDIKEGDEVITTPYTFFATASSIAKLGAKPVFVDIDPLTYNIDTDKVVEYITPRTKAVIVVHLFGLMTPVEKLEPLLKDKGIHLIEDCAQSFGAWRKIDGKIRRCGTIGTFGCFSFYPTKNLGGYGDGGLVTTNLSSLAERIKRLRAHGCSGEYIHEELGMNSRLDAIQAAVLRCRLRHVDDWNRKRRIIAERYRLLFNVYKISEFVKAPSEDEGSYHVYHQYVVRCERRDDLSKYLDENGIGTRVYYPLPLHLQPVFKYLDYRRGDFPEAEKLSQDSLALPMYPELTPDEQEYVVKTIAKFYR